MPINSKTKGKGGERDLADLQDKTNCYDAMYESFKALGINQWGECPSEMVAQLENRRFDAEQRAEAAERERDVLKADAQAEIAALNELATQHAAQLAQAEAEIARLTAELAEARERIAKAGDWYADVLAFHEKFGVKVGDKPHIPEDNLVRLRATLEREEMGELQDATLRRDIVGVADAIADTIYVLLGRAVSFGIDMRPVWRVVHESNVAKVGGAIREDGKILKPEGWEPPDIAAALGLDE